MEKEKNIILMVEYLFFNVKSFYFYIKYLLNYFIKIN